MEGKEGELQMVLTMGLGVQKNHQEMLDLM
jgi:hypothetical protein